MEYGLITSVLEIGHTLRRITGAWAAGRTSFLVPVPGAVDALEASQVLALDAFGVPAAMAFGGALVLGAATVPSAVWA
jgi:hypothetical protein